jgi:lysophospholipase L1-like esterase
VTERRSARAATLRAGLLSSCLAALAVAITACGPGPGVSAGGPAGGSSAGSADPQAAAQPAGHPHHPGHRSPGVSMLAVRDAFSACEQRLETSGGRLPSLAIVGASYTAGVGPDNASLSWAADLARNLRWDAVIYGDPGAGYTRTGDGALGPMSTLLSAERLPSLNPSLVILQAGYDDGRVPPAVERQQVIRTIEQIQEQAPDAQIGLVTVFTPPGLVPTRFYRTDDTIIAAARSVDPNAIIMDPLAGHWVYQHADHGRGLHPTAAGDAWIAQKVGSMLHSHGIDPRPRTAGVAPVTCDLRTLAVNTDATRA